MKSPYADLERRIDDGINQAETRRTALKKARGARFQNALAKLEALEEKRAQAAQGREEPDEPQPERDGSVHDYGYREEEDEGAAEPPLPPNSPRPQTLRNATSEPQRPVVPPAPHAVAPEPPAQPATPAPKRKRVFKRRVTLASLTGDATPTSDGHREKPQAPEETRSAPRLTQAPAPKPPVSPETPPVKPAGPVIDLGKAKPQPPKRVDWNSSAMRQQLSIDHGAKDGGWDDTWADKLGIYDEDD